MSRRTAIVLQSYLLAEWRVIPVCTSDQKTMDVQAGRILTRHKIFGIFKNITLWKATKDILNKNIKQINTPTLKETNLKIKRKKNFFFFFFQKSCYP